MTDRITATIDHPAIFLAGLVTALVCLFVGAAAGTLCNPPLLRHPGAAVLATLAVVIVALAANVSPANAALRSDIASNTAARWPSAVSLIAAAALLADHLDGLGAGRRPPGTKPRLGAMPGT